MNGKRTSSLGHSSFKITADAYAHLEYKSKVAAANAMTKALFAPQINKTSLSLNVIDEEKSKNFESDTSSKVEALIASGVSDDDILKLLSNA